MIVSLDYRNFCLRLIPQPGHVKGLASDSTNSVSRDARLKGLNELLWAALPHFAVIRRGIAA